MLCLLTFEFVSMEMMGAKEPMASSFFLRFGTWLGLGRDSDFICGFRIFEVRTARRCIFPLPRRNWRSWKDPGLKMRV